MYNLNIDTIKTCNLDEHFVLNTNHKSNANTTMCFFLHKTVSINFAFMNKCFHEFGSIERLYTSYSFIKSYMLLAQEKLKKKIIPIR